MRKKKNVEKNIANEEFKDSWNAIDSKTDLHKGKKKTSWKICNRISLNGIERIYEKKKKNGDFVVKNAYKWCFR